MKRNEHAGTTRSRTIRVSIIKDQDDICMFFHSEMASKAQRAKAGAKLPQASPRNLFRNPGCRPHRHDTIANLTHTLDLRVEFLRGPTGIAAAWLFLPIYPVCQQRECIQISNG